MSYVEARVRLVKWIRKQLIGPATQEEELLGITPLERYSTGILFPIVRGEDGLDPAVFSADDESDIADDQGQGGYRVG